MEKETIIKSLQIFAKENGKTPTTREWNGTPHSSVIRRKFGTWNKALEAAGLTPRLNRDKMEPDDMLDAIRNFYIKHKQSPTVREWKGPITTFAIIDAFGSWNGAIAAAGLNPKMQKYLEITPEEIIKSLQSFNSVNNRAPTRTEWREGNHEPRDWYIAREFGSWKSALE